MARRGGDVNVFSRRVVSPALCDHIRLRSVPGVINGSHVFHFLLHNFSPRGGATCTHSYTPFQTEPPVSVYAPFLGTRHWWVTPISVGFKEAFSRGISGCSSPEIRHMASFFHFAPDLGMAQKTLKWQFLIIWPLPPTDANAQRNWSLIRKTKQKDRAYSIHRSISSSLKVISTQIQSRTKPRRLSTDWN